MIFGGLGTVQALDIQTRGPQLYNKKYNKTMLL